MVEMEICIEALSLLDHVHLACIGPRQKAVSEKIASLAFERGVFGRLHFVEPVPPESVVPFISDASCSVMIGQNTCLSYYYSFPNKLLESVFARLPVVSSNLIEMSRFIEKYNVGVIVDGTSAKSIANGIKKVIDSPSSFIAGNETLGIISKNYSWSAQGRRFKKDLWSVERSGAVEMKHFPPANSPRKPPVAISITPVNSGRDMRALKVAESLSRFGFDSYLYDRDDIGVRDQHEVDIHPNFAVSNRDVKSVTTLYRTGILGDLFERFKKSRMLNGIRFLKFKRDFAREYTLPESLPRTCSVILPPFL